MFRLATEPDPSQSSPVGKKHKKPWIVSGCRSSFHKHLDDKRSIYGRYPTERGAIQAMDHMRKDDARMNKAHPGGPWFDRKYKVEYLGK